MKIAASFHQASLNIKDNLTIFSGGILTVWVGLTILGGFLLIYLNALQLSSIYFKTQQYSVFLNSTISSERLKEIKEKISYTGVKDIRWTSGKQAKKDLFESFGKDAELLESLSLRRFPDIIEFQVDPKQIDAGSLTDFIKTIPEVSEVLTGTEVKGQVENYFQIIRFTGLMFLGVLGLAIIILVNTTIQVTQFTKLKEIEILKTIGATPWFIRFPYLMEGFLQALTGSVLSIITIYMLYKVVIAGITFNEATYSITANARFFGFSELGIFMGISVILGLIGAWLSTGKILRILPG